MSTSTQKTPTTSPATEFPELITDYIQQRIQHSTQPEALQRQFVVDSREDVAAPGFVSDPVGDLDANAAPGLLHKYPGRVLLVLTGSCAVHCRYCFRRHFPYQEQRMDADKLNAAISYLQSRPEIHEVILSGGDPLSVSNRRLAMIVDRLAELPSIRRLRIHSRTPTVRPERVDADLLALLARVSQQVVLVTHVNHADELSDQTGVVMQQLQQIGVQLLNQAVLLKGINDQLQTQVDLSEQLFAQQILPYYLHQLDPVAGAAHFHVPIETGRLLVEQMRAQLPGYLVPRYVCEPAGALSKQPL